MSCNTDSEIATSDTHDVKAGSKGQFAFPVAIEDDCWIGAGCTILPGVIIGKGSNIAAGAVVARDIPPATLAAGVPAKVVRKLADDRKQAHASQESSFDGSAGEMPLSTKVETTRSFLGKLWTRFA